MRRAAGKPEQASRGHQRIVWSKGLKELLCVAERTEQDITGERQDGEVIVTFDVAAWREVTRVPGLDVAVLDAAEEGAAAAMFALLRPYGIEPIGGMQTREAVRSHV